MSRRTRILFFGAVLIVFFTLSPILLLYVAGYRLSGDDHIITYTGTLHLRSIPKKAQIYLDDAIQDLSTPASINGLSEKLYRIRVEKDGYYGWSKTLGVEQGVVTRSDLLYLFPTQPEEQTILDGHIFDVALSPDRKNVAIIVERDSVRSVEVRSMKHLSESFEIWNSQSSDLIPPSSLQWSPDGDRLLAVVDEGNDFLVLDVNTINTGLLLPELHGVAEADVQWSSKGHTQILYRSSADQLSLLTFSDAGTTSSPLLSEQVLAFQVFDGSVYYLRGDDHLLYKTSLDSTVQQQLTRDVADIAVHNNLFHISTNGSVAVLSANGSLYLIDPHSASGLLEIDHDVRSVSWQSTSEKLLYAKDNEVWAYIVVDKTTYPRLSAGHKELITRSAHPILFASWFHTYEYILYGTSDGIFAAELDGRDVRNTIRLTHLISEKPYWDYDANEGLLLLWDSSFRSIVLEAS